MDLRFIGDDVKICRIDKKDETGIVFRKLKLSRIYSGERYWHWNGTLFKRFRIKLDERINQHIVIVGESGSGKSNLS